MNADEAIAVAEEAIRHNQEVNASYLSNASVAALAGMASKLLDVATQLKAYEPKPDAVEPAPTPEPTPEPEPEPQPEPTL